MTSQLLRVCVSDHANGDYNQVRNYDMQTQTLPSNTDVLVFEVEFSQIYYISKHRVHTPGPSAVGD